MVRRNRFIWILGVLIAAPAWPVAADSTAAELGVSVTSVIQSKQVPLNRNVEFIIRVAWEGPIDAVEIGEVLDPIFTNLDAIGGSSSNRVSGVPGGQRSVKEISYTLKPKTLGMAYIEPASISYTDRQTNLVHSLRTRRMAVEVVSPVPEKAAGIGLAFWVLFGALFTAGAVVGGWMVVRHKRLRTVSGAEPQPVLPGEEFLRLLKSTVDLRNPDRKEAFAALSKLFRRYMAETAGVAAASMATPELIRLLSERGTDEDFVRKCESVLSKADLTQFSGRDASQAELDEAYTIVETVLETRLAEERKRLAKAEAEKEKPGRFGFLRLKKK